MKNTDSLFRLIKSLSPHEKNYIKRYSLHDKKSKRDLIQLFDNINRLAEDSPKQDYFNKIRTRNRSLLKSQLYEIVLNALVSYSSDAEIEVMQLLQQAQALLDKGLKKDAQRKISQYIQRCKQYDLGDYLPAGYSKRLKASPRFSAANTENELEILADMKANADWILRRIELEKLQFSIGHKRIAWGLSPRTDEELDWVKNAINAPILRENQEEHTISQVIIREYAILLCKGLLNDSSEVELLENLFAQVDAHPYFKQRDPAYYYNIAFNYLYVLGVNQKPKMFGQVEERLNVLLEKEKSSKVNKSELQEKLLFCRCLMHISQGEYQEALPTAKKLFACHPWQVRDSARKAHIYENVARIFFYAKKHLLALDVINLFLNDDDTKRQPQRLINAKLFELILHYELEHDELVQNLAINVYREMLRKEMLFEEHNQLIKLFRKLISTPRNKQEPIFNELYKEIQTWNNSIKNYDFISAFDIVEWVRSKAKNTLD